MVSFAPYGQLVTFYGIGLHRNSVTIVGPVSLWTLSLATSFEVTISEHILLGGEKG